MVRRRDRRQVVCCISLVRRISVVQEMALKVKIGFEVSESFRETKKSIKFSASMNLWAPRTHFLLDSLVRQSGLAKHRGDLARSPGIFIIFV